MPRGNNGNHRTTDRSKLRAGEAQAQSNLDVTDFSEGKVGPPGNNSVASRFDCTKPLNIESSLARETTSRSTQQRKHLQNSIGIFGHFRGPV